MKPEQIAQIISRTDRTVRNWIRLLDKQGEERVFKIFKPVITPSPLDLEKLKQEFENNKTAFNREIAHKFNCSTKTIEKFRHRFGYT
jgi:transposase